MWMAGNSPPSVDVKRPAIQPEARFPQLSCAGDAIRSEKPPAVHHSRGFRFAEGAQRALAAFSGLLTAVANRRWRASYRVSSLRRRPRSSSKLAPAALGAQADLSAICARHAARAFAPFPAEVLEGAIRALQTPLCNDRGCWPNAPSANWRASAADRSASRCRAVP